MHHVCLEVSLQSGGGGPGCSSTHSPLPLVEATGRGTGSSSTLCQGTQLVGSRPMADPRMSVTQALCR